MTSQPLAYVFARTSDPATGTVRIACVPFPVFEARGGKQYIIGDGQQLFSWWTTPDEGGRPWFPGL